MELRTKSEKKRNLNGFHVLAVTCGNPKKQRIYDFLATCDADDFKILFDSSAFNDLMSDVIEYSCKDESRDVQERIIGRFKDALEFGTGIPAGSTTEEPEVPQ
jgi:hypothetical protein